MSMATFMITKKNNKPRSLASMQSSYSLLLLVLYKVSYVPFLPQRPHNIMLCFAAMQ